MLGFGLGIVASNGVRVHDGIGVYAAEMSIQFQRLPDTWLVQKDHLLSRGEASTDGCLALIATCRSIVLVIERRARPATSGAKGRQASDGPELEEGVDQPLLHGRFGGTRRLVLATVRIHEAVAVVEEGLLAVLDDLLHDQLPLLSICESDGKVVILIQSEVCQAVKVRVGLRFRLGERLGQDRPPVVLNASHDGRVGIDDLALALELAVRHHTQDLIRHVALGCDAERASAAHIKLLCHHACRRATPADEALVLVLVRRRHDGLHLALEHELGALAGRDGLDQHADRCVAQRMGCLSAEAHGLLEHAEQHAPLSIRPHEDAVKLDRLWVDTDREAGRRRDASEFEPRRIGVLQVHKLGLLVGVAGVRLHGNLERAQESIDLAQLRLGAHADGKALRVILAPYGRGRL